MAFAGCTHLYFAFLRVKIKNKERQRRESGSFFGSRGKKKGEKGKADRKWKRKMRIDMAEI